MLGGYNQAASSLCSWACKEYTHPSVLISSCVAIGIYLRGKVNCFNRYTNSDANNQSKSLSLNFRDNINCIDD